MTQDVPEEVSKYMAKLGRKGAKAANESRTPEQRRRIAQKAIKARWSKERATIAGISPAKKARKKRTAARSVLSTLDQPKP